MLTPQQTQLYEQLLAFRIDDGRATLGFVNRLARENGWTLAYAARAIVEYKRFLLLCAASQTACTPSDEVDQVWHLHLLYTRNYWDELCAKVLGFPLHHGPTKGGGGERRRFSEQYEATLSAYAKTFGHAAPPDLWPPLSQRMGETNFRRVNLHRNWILPKPLIR